MRLICPGCSAEYEIDDDLIPPEGREVQCSNCDHGWFQRPPPLDSPLSDELGTDAHLRATAPDTAATSEDTAGAGMPEAVGEGARPRPSLPRPVVVTAEGAPVVRGGAAGSATPPVSAPPAGPAGPDAADVDALPSSPAPAAAASGPSGPVTSGPAADSAAARLDPRVHEILVSEAQRELRARRAASLLETQEELGLESALPAASRRGAEAEDAAVPDPADGFGAGTREEAASPAPTDASAGAAPAEGGASADADPDPNRSAKETASPAGNSAAAASPAAKADERRDSSDASEVVGAIVSPTPTAPGADARHSDGAPAKATARATSSAPAGREARAGGGFALGFVSVLVVAVAVALLDRFAQPLAEAWPPAAPVLEALAHQVAVLRQWLEHAVGAVAGWLG